MSVDVELPVREGFGGQDSSTTDFRPGPKPAIFDCRVGGAAQPLRTLSRGDRGGVGAGPDAQRIWQDLRADHGFNESYQSVQRFVRLLRTIRPLPFRRMECDPGAEAQIDFGTGAPVIIPIDPNQPVTFLTPLTSAPSQGLTQQALNGVKGKTRRRKTHVIRVVLSHSRKAYSEAVYRQTTDDFIRCLENAFHHFGGVPKTLVIDNLKAAVTKADWYDPVINPKIAAFCDHYGTILLPAKPYTPQHPGKVERQVGYVKNNGLKGRSFASLEDENAYLLHWEETIADTRIHGTTKKQVGKVFEEVERSALRSLPIERFACFREAQRRVHRDGHVEVDKAYYSVPPEYVGRRVWARWDGRIVRIFNDRLVQIAIHARHEAGRFSTQSQHIANEKIAGVERGATALLQKVRLCGDLALARGQKAKAYEEYRHSFDYARALHERDPNHRSFAEYCAAASLKMACPPDCVEIAAPLTEYLQIAESITEQFEKLEPASDIARRLRLEIEFKRYLVAKREGDLATCHRAIEEQFRLVRRRYEVSKTQDDATAYEAALTYGTELAKAENDQTTIDAFDSERFQLYESRARNPGASPRDKARYACLLARGESAGVDRDEVRHWAHEAFHEIGDRDPSVIYSAATALAAIGDYAESRRFFESGLAMISDGSELADQIRTALSRISAAAANEGVNP
ncbi:MAG: IS21 family transposase [Planctomycetes bacterium]|nr:IS21 family transposase [Planctomycetota bacterium]